MGTTIEDKEQLTKDIGKMGVQKSDLTFEEVMGCMSACFEWADSYDSKDWERLRKCIAPTLRVSLNSSPSHFFYRISQAKTSKLTLLRSIIAPSSTKCGKPCPPTNS